MALGVPAVPFTYVAHLLGIVAIVLVLVWNLHFRGGLAWNSDNKAQIFNVLSLQSLPICFYSIQCYLLSQFHSTFFGVGLCTKLAIFFHLF